MINTKDPTRRLLNKTQLDFGDAGDPCWSSSEKTGAQPPNQDAYASSRD